jgi:hypothetical protein
VGGHGQPDPLEDPGLEPGRRLGGRQQLKQLLAGRHQLPHVLAAPVALIEVRDRVRAIASGQDAKR